MTLHLTCAKCWEPVGTCEECLKKMIEKLEAVADRSNKLTIDGPATNVAILDMLSALINLMEVAERGGQLKGYHSVALNRVRSAYGIFRAGVLPLEPPNW